MRFIVLLILLVILFPVCEAVVQADSVILVTRANGTGNYDVWVDGIGLVTYYNHTKGWTPGIDERFNGTVDFETYLDGRVELKIVYWPTGPLRGL